MSTMATRPMHTTVDDKSAYFRLLLSYSPALTLRTVLESYRGARLALDLLRQKPHCRSSRDSIMRPGSESSTNMS